MLLVVSGRIHLSFYYREHTTLLEVTHSSTGGKVVAQTGMAGEIKEVRGPTGLRDGPLCSSSCSPGGTPRSAPDSESWEHPPGLGRPRPAGSKWRAVHLGFRGGTGIGELHHAGLHGTVGLGPGLPPHGAFRTLGSGSGDNKGCWRPGLRPVALGQQRLRANRFLFICFMFCRLVFRCHRE